MIARLIRWTEVNRLPVLLATLALVGAGLWGLRTTPVDALPWGSRSISRTRCSATASDAPKLTAVVVLPTPPF